MGTEKYRRFMSIKQQRSHCTCGYYARVIWRRLGQYSFDPKEIQLNPI